MKKPDYSKFNNGKNLPSHQRCRSEIILSEFSSEIVATEEQCPSRNAQRLINK